MPDFLTKAKRSALMATIRSSGNKDTELALVWVFRAHGITGWRRQVQIRSAERGTRNKRAVRSPANSFRTPRSEFRVFTVRPDFVFPKLRLAVFVDGCFWHACPRHTTKPRNNAAFWRKKFAANKARDRLVTRTLRKAGWRVLRIWEHELARKREARLVKRINHALVISLARSSPVRPRLSIV